MDDLRRIPLALLAAFAANLLATVLAELSNLGHDGVEIVMGLSLATSVLVPFGLFVLASRATVREVEMGATLAAAAATGGALLVIGYMVLRPSGAMRWMMLASATLEAMGFAVMIGRRYPLLAIAELVVVVGGSLAFRFLDLPVQLHAVRSLVIVAIELAILLLVSPPIVPAVLLPAERSPLAPGETPPLEQVTHRPARDRAYQLALVSACLFAISMCLPSVRMDGLSLFGPAKTEDTLGVACLLYGWFLFPGWLANPFMGVGGILMAIRRPRGAFAFGCLSIISALIAPIILFTAKLNVHAMLIGYYVWLASVVTFTVAAYLRLRARRRADPTRL